MHSLVVLEFVEIRSIRALTICTILEHNFKIQLCTQIQWVFFGLREF